jgi:outer membrane protein TolC
MAAPASALDLESALREAAARHPALAASAARTSAAEHRVGPMGSWPSPMLELAAVNVPESGIIDSDPMTMRMVGVSQRLPIFGRMGLARRSARAEADAERAGARLVAYEVYGRVWRAYAEAWYAGERERAGEAHLGTMERMMASARARYASGAGRLEEVLRAEAERAMALVDLAEYRGEVRRARAMLDAVRGRPAAEAVAESLAAPPAAELPESPLSWLAAVSDAHPGLGAMAARVNGERYSAKAARRGVFPDVEVGFEWGFRETLVTVGPQGHAPGVGAGTVLITPQDDMWTARVAFELPIFAFSDMLAEGRARDAAADAMDAERRAMKLELEAEVAAAHAQALAAARATSLLADTVVVTYRRALEASWSAYAAGTTDLWRTLEAAHALYEQEVALSRAREMRAMAEARFIELTGRGDLLGVRLPETPGGGS